MTELELLAAAAREASRRLAFLPTDEKNAALLDLASGLESRRGEVLAASARDMAAAERAGLGGPKLRRLELGEKGLTQLIEGVRQVAALPDPVGEVTRDRVVPSGLRVRKVRAPLGVIMMIYEARPGVTIDAFALCFKAGNACILKGGREAAESNAVLARIARDALQGCGLPEAALTLITTSDRDEIRQLLSMESQIDLVIPRGGESLIRFVHEHSRIPTVQHFQGVCHALVDASADLEMALDICVTGKTSAPATCNALECVLVHEEVARRFVPALAERCAAAGVELRGDGLVTSLAPSAKQAVEDDWGREFLDLILAARVVKGLDEAIAHIQRYGSGHTDAIITKDRASAERFTAEVQSSCVLVNASTRFNDGFQLGLGAEIGISTSRVHAFGPMGLEELTTQRYVVEGSGQVR
jgi:glutamate-5-semialdehyde dehydrogenase